MFSELEIPQIVFDVWSLVVSVLSNITIVKKGVKMLETFICQIMHTLNSKLKIDHKIDIDERHVQPHYGSVLK